MFVNSIRDFEKRLFTKPLVSYLYYLYIYKYYTILVFENSMGLYPKERKKKKIYPLK